MKLLRMLAACLALTAVIALPRGAHVAAQGGFESDAFPELMIQVSDTGFLLPSAVPAGRTLISLQNTASEPHAAILARLPDDLTIGELFAGAGSDEPPAWLMQSQFPGFPGEAMPGETAQAVVDLTPGLYVILDNQIGVFAVVPAGEATPAAVADPATTATVSLLEFGFQLPDNLTAGPQVWQVVNAGRVPHELVLFKVPDGTTTDDVVNAMASNNDISEGDAGGLGWLSAGATAWTSVDLDPGTYAALCFVFDPDTGMPHAMEGMIAVFTVR